MSSAHSSSSIGKPSAVFVQVPPSPFDLAQYQSSISSRHVPASTNSTKPLKENTPLKAPRLSMLQSAASSSSSLKRKLSDSDSLSSVVDGTGASSKRIKSASAGTPLKFSQINSPTRLLESTSNACDEYPNGWTYCHQCCKKRDLDTTIHCTYIEEKHVGKSNALKQRRCVSKYCRACLQNRYGQDLEALMNNRKWETGHIANAGYTFKCPKCCDECNCPRCRKAKGLDPIGTMKRPEIASAKKEKVQQAKNQSATHAQPKKRVRKPKIKPLPAVKWTRIAEDLSHSEVEERMHIREFILRFNGLGDSAIPKQHLDELEQINGKYNGQEGVDPVSWVGDACVRSVILMLLGILSVHNSPFSEASQVACKSLRSVGLALNRVWAVLEEWRESINDTAGASSSVEGSNDLFSIAEPLPASEHFWNQARRSTRTMTSAQDSFVINNSSQLVPVVLSLIDLTLRSQSVREALEEGIKESKEIVRISRDAIKLESERWDRVKKQQDAAKDKTGFQAAKRLHKDIVSALESSLAIAQCESMQRFAPLGSDPEGRVFYALSPGHAEREAAYEFSEALSSELTSKQKLKKKGRTLKPTEREDLHDWSWMILVWGKKPPSAFSPPTDDEDGDAKMDDDTEAWWCFSEPSDIKQLAEWLALDNDLDEKTSISASPAVDSEQASLKQLVTSLKDFASLLEWRLREDKYQLPPVGSKAVSTSAKGKTK